MKKILTLSLSLLISMLCMTACRAEENFMITMQIGSSTMTVNGTETAIDEGRGTAPIIINDRTLVPIRAIIEEMGGAIHWEADTQNVIIALENNIIMLTIDSRTAFVNEDIKTLDIAPAIINDRTMLPIRFISENLGYNVDWNGGEQLITISR